RLITLCEQFDTWVLETRQSRIVNGVVPPADSKRIEDLVEYTNKTFVPALIKLFKDEMKLKIVVELEVSTDYINGAMLPWYHDVMVNQDYDRLLNGYSLF